MSANTVVVGITHPSSWDARRGERIAADIEALRDMDPRIEVVDCRYIETFELRTARGRLGTAAASDPVLRALAPELTDAQRAALARAEVLLTADLPFEVEALAPNLRWVQSVGAGVGHLVSAGIPTDRIALTTAAGVNGPPIAEFVLARLLAFFKRHTDLAELQAQRQWKGVFGQNVAGRTLGVLGVGGIGSEIARRAKAFDMTVYAMRRHADRPAPHVDRLFAPDDLHAMLGACDAVVSAVPETADTVGTMDAPAFAAMREGSFYCNVGRGSFVVEPDLVAALRSGHLAQAALDVAAQEPLPSDDPLWEAPNLLLSAHCSSDGSDHFTGVFRLFRENLARYLAGEPLLNTYRP